MDKKQYFEVRIQTKYDSRKQRIRRIINFGLCLLLIVILTMLLVNATPLNVNTLMKEVRANAMTIATEQPKETKKPVKKIKSTRYVSRQISMPLIEPATSSAIKISHEYENKKIDNIEKSIELKSIVPFIKKEQKKENDEWKHFQKEVRKEAIRQKKLAEKRRRLRIKRERQRLARLRRRNAKYVPSGFGKTLAYMKWDCVTAKGTPQYKLKSQAEHYNSKGMGMVNGRFAIAIKPYYGAVGDYLDITFADGTILKAIVVDEKGEENEPGKGNYSNIYASSNRRQLARGVTNRVHTDGSVLEFVVDGEGKTTGWRGFAGYNGHKTVRKLYPQFAQNIKYISKMGNFWK